MLSAAASNLFFDMGKREVERKGLSDSGDLRTGHVGRAGSR